MTTPLDQVTSIKVKLGLLVVASVAVAAVVATIGSSAGVSPWLSLPVTVLLALGVTQLLAVGMTSPLRQMTDAARRMARGDYAVRVDETSGDEIGQLACAFNTMANDLAAVDRERRDLIANVSHELRTPLTALCAVLENLVDGVSEPDPAALRTALDQAERLAALVSDLLDLSRVDAGIAPLAWDTVPVTLLLEQAVAEARSTADTTGRDVTWDLTVRPAAYTAYGDPARLRQLVANLLDNASRHSPAGGVVRVTADGYEAGWRIEIADHGPGIAPEDRERVFERFGTLANHDGGGTGLGLAIARWVTDLHGGVISFVDPADGPDGAVGARVRVDLPTRTDRPTPRQETAMTTPASPPPPPGPPVEPKAAPAGPAAGFETVASATSSTGGRPPYPPPAPLFADIWPEKAEPDIRPVLASLGVGLLAAFIFPERNLGIGTVLVLLAAGGTVLAFAKHRRDPFTLACAGLCVLLSVVPVLRDAEWIAVLCMFAGAALCIAGLVRGRTFAGFFLGGIAWPFAGLRGIPWLGKSLRVLTGFGHGPAVLRTALWSLLGVTVFGLLFASADALFAEWVGVLVPDLRLDTFVQRAFITMAVGGVVLAAAYLGLNPPPVEREGGTPQRLQHRFEWLAPVLLVDAVFAVFLIAQATVIFGGHGYLRRTTGLTYAEYVHQGFGQLTVATALTLLVVWAAGRKAPRETQQDRIWVQASLGLLCAMTLVVVASALYRMHVYQEAYGFTELRLLVDVFEGWLGLLVLAMLVGLFWPIHQWLPRLALLSGVVALLGIAAINPDAWIARQNLERYDETGKVDWYYLRGLSSDAVPVLAELKGEERACALAGHEVGNDDWLEWNLGRWQARDDIGDEEATLPSQLVCDEESDTRRP
ncbi:DUF4153 domain-containing protein [Nocardioides speluncae]|uniref:DUF4153 domain-containing protein n=1 Tax=Nocardioides speluncae TaxID=2670337 RepID=UPI000D6A0555|nr:DUF4153 domain-containing protein [Nocardioides speluncae]